MDTFEETKEVNPLELITWSSKTHVGMRRTENQDAIGVIENENYKLFIVADGMGGVTGGAIASNIAIATIKSELEKLAQPTQQNLLQAVTEANKAIFDRGIEERTLSGMGTTLVGLLFYKNRLTCANVGDSRAYLVRDGLAMQLTQDHTVVSELLRSGAIDENQFSAHPISHMLTRSLGPTAEILVDCFTIPNAPLASDRFLLCSDGLYNHIESSEIAEIIASNAANLACEQLVNLANERGGSDNISVIVIDVADNYSSPTLEVLDERDNLENTIERTGDDLRYANGYPAKDLSETYEKLVNDPQAHQSDVKQKITSNTIFNKQIATVMPNRLTPLGVGIISVVVIMLWWAIDRGHQKNSNRPTDSNIQTQISSDTNTTNEVYGNSKQENKADLIASDTDNTQVATQDSEQSAINILNQPFASEKLERARTRSQFLQKRISELENKVEAFDKPLSGAIAQNLSSTTRKLDEVKDQISSIDGQLAETARGLAVLYGQQQRMRSTELLKLAGEVAEFSSEVSEQKKAFETASWNYLREREKIERDPRNVELRQKVDELGIARRQELDKLGLLVRQSIIADTLKLDRQSTDLNKQKELLELQLQSLQDDLDFIQVLMSQEPARRDSFRASLIEDLRRQKAEFATLQNMIISLLGQDEGE